MGMLRLEYKQNLNEVTTKESRYRRLTRGHIIQPFQLQPLPVNCQHEPVQIEPSGFIHSILLYSDTHSRRSDSTIPVIKLGLQGDNNSGSAFPKEQVASGSFEYTYPINGSVKSNLAQ